MKYLILLVLSFNLYAQSELLITLGDDNPYLNKEIECVATGNASTTSTTAYGTWEFEAYLNSTTYSNALRVYFISSANNVYPNTNAYYTDNGSTGNNDLRFAKATTAPAVTNLFVSTDGLLPATTWVKIKIVRTAGNIFTVYLNDVEVVEASGSNPVTDNAHTTSSYIVLAFRGGDKLRNFKVNNVMLNPKSFSALSGTWVFQ